MTRHKSKRNGKRHFNAKELGQKIELKAVTFLGQQFVITAQSGNKNNRRYDLLGMSGTQLEGVLIRGIAHEVLRKFRDNGTYDEYLNSISSPIIDNSDKPDLQPAEQSVLDLEGGR